MTTQHNRETSRNLMEMVSYGTFLSVTFLLILLIWAKLAKSDQVTKNGRKRPKMTDIGPKVWKMTSETISIGFLLLLRSFWVVIWLVYKILEFKAKSGPKRPQMTDIGLNVWKVTSETLSIVFLLLLRSFWVVTWLVYDNFEFWPKIGQKWPKKAPNDQKWPESLKSDIQNHLH